MHGIGRLSVADVATAGGTVAADRLQVLPVEGRTGRRRRPAGGRHLRRGRDRGDRRHRRRPRGRRRGCPPDARAGPTSTRCSTVWCAPSPSGSCPCSPPTRAWCCRWCGFPVEAVVAERFPGLDDVVRRRTADVLVRVLISFALNPPDDPPEVVASVVAGPAWSTACARAPRGQRERHDPGRGRRLPVGARSGLARPQALPVAGRAPRPAAATAGGMAGRRRRLGGVVVRRSDRRLRRHPTARHRLRRAMRRTRPTRPCRRSRPTGTTGGAPGCTCRCSTPGSCGRRGSPTRGDLSPVVYVGLALTVGHRRRHRHQHRPRARAQAGPARAPAVEGGPGAERLRALLRGAQPWPSRQRVDPRGSGERPPRRVVLAVPAAHRRRQPPLGVVARGGGTGPEGPAGVVVAQRRAQRLGADGGAVRRHGRVARPPGGAVRRDPGGDRASCCSRSSTTSSTTGCCASGWPTGATSAAGRRTAGTATTSPRTSSSTTSNATPITTPTRPAGTRPCGTSTRLRSCPRATRSMICVAAVPPLWRRVMDHRVLAHYGGDVTLANIHPPSARRCWLATAPPDPTWSGGPVPQLPWAAAVPQGRPAHQGGDSGDDTDDDEGATHVVDIQSLLGDEAESLLTHESKGIPQRRPRTCRGPTTSTGSFSLTERSPQVLRNLQSLFDHGRLGRHRATCRSCRSTRASSTRPPPASPPTRSTSTRRTSSSWPSRAAATRWRSTFGVLGGGVARATPTRSRSS